MSFSNYTDQELDHQYACSHWSKRSLTPDEIIGQFVDVCAQESLKVEKEFIVSKDLKYGDTDRQSIDILSSHNSPKDAPVFVFFHGGYWQTEELNKAHNLLFGKHLVPAGAVVMSVGYDLAPSAKMEDIVLQACNGVKFCLERAKQIGTRGVYISGHSAGGHLAAITFSLIDDPLLKGIIPISGVFDLTPIIRTTVNDHLQMDETSAWENSPMKYVQKLETRKSPNSKALIILGAEESPEFHRQASEYNNALSKFMDSKMLSITESDHFSIIEDVVNNDSPVIKAIIDFMELLL